MTIATPDFAALPVWNFGIWSGPFEWIDDDYAACADCVFLSLNWTGTDPTERAFYRAFRDFNPLNDFGIG